LALRSILLALEQSHRSLARTAQNFVGLVSVQSSRQVGDSEFRDRQNLPRDSRAVQGQGFTIIKLSIEPIEHAKIGEIFEPHIHADLVILSSSISKRYEHSLRNWRSTSAFGGYFRTLNILQ
jgi:hypothetical protein